MLSNLGWWYIVTGATIGVCLLITILIFFRFMCTVGLFTNQLSKWSSCTMILSVVYVSMDLHRIVHSYLHNKESVDTWQYWQIATNVMIYYGATLSLYICLVLRVYDFFQRTNYVISNNDYNFFIVILVFDGIAIIVFIIAGSFVINDVL